MDWKDFLSKIVKITEGLNDNYVKTDVTAVVRDYEDAVEVLKVANQYKLTIYPFAFNKHHIGPKIRANIGLDLKGLNQVMEISENDFYVTSQVGVSLRELFLKCKDKGFLMPADYDGSLGGFLSTNLPTIFSTFYGYPKNLLLMAKIVTGDGVLIKSGGKTLKFSSGYKIHRTLTGALGWLGIYLEATLKVYPYPEEIVTAKINDIVDLYTSKYRPFSLIYNYDKGNIYTTAVFMGFKNAIEKIKKEINVSFEEGFPSLDYPNEGTVISLHVTRGREVEYFKRLTERVKDVRIRAFGATGYIRVESEKDINIDELRREFNDTLITVERAIDYKGDYWGFKSEILKKLKSSLDPNNVLLPRLIQ